MLGSALDVKDRKKENMSLERENILVTTHVIKKIHVVSPLKRATLSSLVFACFDTWHITEKGLKY